MKTKFGGISKYIFIVIAGIVLLRFSPIIMRILQMVAIAAIRFWWVAVPIVAITLITLKILKRRAITAKTDDELSQLNLRDVTNSVQDQPENK